MEAKKFDLSGIGLSEKQINEHIKLYEGYIKKSDEIREKFSKVNWEDANTTQSEVRSLILGETFANNGVMLHEAYFENLRNNDISDGFRTESSDSARNSFEFRHAQKSSDFRHLGKESEPEGKIKELILEKFKNIEEFKKRLTAFGLSSRGWVVLAWDLENNRLRLFGTDQHDIAVWNCVLLIVLDVYEHAYFIDFETNKKSYIGWFLTHINWKVVEERVGKIKNEK